MGILFGSGERGFAISRSAAAAFAGTIAILLALALTGSARADTPFGGDPSLQVSGDKCEEGFPPVFHGASSCLWFWSNQHEGDTAPIPVTGGSGVVTSVTLPAMPNPGPMQAVVLTSEVAASENPALPDYICCQIKELSPTFTVPPNQIATVPLDLPVSATAVANFHIPGASQASDFMGISVLSPTATLPLKNTGKTPFTSPTDFDSDGAYFPAPTQPNGEFVKPTDPSGVELLARFTMGPTPPAPGPPAGGGLKLTKGPAVGADGKTVKLGTATDPPTVATTQTLTAPAAARVSSAGASKGKKPVVYGTGKTKIANGKTVPIKLKLNGKARAKLRKAHKLKATLTVVATNPQGESQTVTESVTIKAAPHHH